MVLTFAFTALHDVISAVVHFIRINCIGLISSYCAHGPVFTLRRSPCVLSGSIIC